MLELRHALNNMYASTCQLSPSNQTNGRSHWESSSITISAHLTPKGLVVRPGSEWVTRPRATHCLERSAAAGDVCCGEMQWGIFEKLPHAISRVHSQWCSHLQWRDTEPLWHVTYNWHIRNNSFVYCAASLVPSFFNSFALQRIPLTSCIIEEEVNFKWCQKTCSRTHAKMKLQLNITGLHHTRADEKSVITLVTSVKNEEEAVKKHTNAAAANSSRRNPFN